jgi:primary-amine oxidase
MGKKSPYGTVVGPGVLGTSHQHFISLRIGTFSHRYKADLVDPAIDGHNNTIVQDDIIADLPSEANGHGIGFRVKSTPITESGWADADPFANRTFKMVRPPLGINADRRPILMSLTQYQ